MINRPAGGDRVYPGGEFGVAAKGPQVLPYGKPDLLAHISGTVFVAEHGIDQPENRLVVRAHQRPERVLVACLGTLDELALGFGGDIDCVRHEAEGTVSRTRSCASFITQW